MKAKTGYLKGLALTRKVGQITCINNGEILIEIAEVRGKHVKLIFQCEKEKFKIDRLESISKKVANDK